MAVFPHSLLCFNCTAFLAHLSGRLIGELIVCPMVRHPSYVVVRPSTMLKRLLRNRLADRSQILCGASLGRGTKFCSRHLGHMTKMAATPLYMVKTLQKSSPEPAGGFPRNLVCSIGDSPRHSCSNVDPGLTLTYFTARSNLVT